jgi:hypothetical protein
VDSEKPVLPQRNSIDYIFNQVKDYDLVLTKESSLADAINDRYDGESELAYTPRQLVDEENSGFRRKIFLELVEKNQMSWRQASYLLRNILDCWQQTGELNSIKQYDRFEGDALDRIIEVLTEVENPYSKLEKHSIEAEKVAVIGLDRFKALEKKILPDEFDEIEVFSGEKKELSEFKVFESKTELVQSLKENIERLGPENTGILVHPESPYQPLIESVFEVDQIPFVSQTDLSEDNDLRTVINLIRVGLSKENVRIKDVKPIIGELDIFVPHGKENVLVSEANGLEEFKEFFNVLGYLDFGEILRKYTELTGRDMRKLRGVLDDLNMLEEPISLETLGNLEYYLNSFELKESESSNGAVLADPREISFLDRQLVFFIGMNSEWTRETGTKPWTDKTQEEKNNLEDFSSLIQSGERQVYMVQDREMNKDITPCFHLNQILDVEFSTFRDLPHRRYSPETEVEEKGFKKYSTNVEVDEIEVLSQSRLNSLALSPRLYYFEKLVSDGEDEKIEKGNIFHDYAEFYINHPEFVEGLANKKVLDFMVEYVRPYIDQTETEKLRTELKIGLNNIHEFLDQNKVAEKDHEGFEKTDSENVFGKEFDKPIDSGVTEMSFEDKSLGLKGKVDLVMNETHLVDYKSGRKYDAKDIVESSNIELYEDADWPDFQALMYLTYLRQHVPETKLKFTFLNFLHNLEDMIDGNGELDDNTVTVTYFPSTFEDKISELEMYEYLLKNSGKTSYQGKMLRKLGCPEFREFFKNRKIEKPFDKNELLDSDLAEEFKEYAKKEVGDYKYVRKGCGQVLKSFVEFRRSNYFKEDLDKFEEFLDEKITELNRYRTDRFPLDADPDDLYKRDMILDTGGGSDY